MLFDEGELRLSCSPCAAHRGGAAPELARAAENLKLALRLRQSRVR